MILDLFSEYPKDVTEPYRVTAIFQYLKQKNYALPFYLMNTEKNILICLSATDLFEAKIYQKK